MAARSDRFRVLDEYAAYNARGRGAQGVVGYALKRIAAASIAPMVSAWSRGSLPPSGEKCDVLFLHRWGGGEARARPLADALSARGLRVAHQVIPGRAARIQRRLLCRPARRAPASWRVDVHHAAFLLCRFRPRVVVTFEYYSPFLSCLRSAAAGAASIVNVAHSVVPPGNESNMFDADYYFVYGPSSVQHCRDKPIRIGTTKLVETGSCVFPERLADIPPGPPNVVLFFSQLSSELDAFQVRKSALRSIVKRNTKIVREFAVAHPECRVLVKPHPTENVVRTSALWEGLSNVTVLDRSVGISEALASASVAVVMWSNASLEAALHGRPVVVINDSSMADDYLQLERFFLPRARSAPELAARLTEALGDPSRQRVRCQEFVRWHLARTVDAATYAAACVASVASGKEDFEFIDLPARHSALSDPRGGR